MGANEGRTNASPDTRSRTDASRTNALTHRRSQDFVWGALFHFFCQKKVDDLFSCRRPQRPSKYISKSKPPSKTVLKIDSCSGWGCTFTFSL